MSSISMLFHRKGPSAADPALLPPIVPVPRRITVGNDYHDGLKDELLSGLKKEVKGLMELIAYRKIVNEESGVVYSLCMAVESCVRHGLKRRIFESTNNFDSNYYLALLSRLDHDFACASAAYVASKVRGARQTTGFSNNSPGGPQAIPSEATSPIYKLFHFGNSGSSALKDSGVEMSPNRAMFGADSSSSGYKQGGYFASSPDYHTRKSPFGGDRLLWIKIALLEKHLMNILTCLVQNSAKLYRPFAILADPVQGPLVIALLAGPCSIEYSRFRGNDIPPCPDSVSVDNVLTRRRFLVPTSTPSRPNLLGRTRHFSIANNDLMPSSNRVPGPAMSIDLLNQDNFGASTTLSGHSGEDNKTYELVFAKNNVTMQPPEANGPIPGYLSVFRPLVATGDDNKGALIRWTPNTLLHTWSYDSSPSPRQVRRAYSRDPMAGTNYTAFDNTGGPVNVVTMQLSDVSHIHCHMRPHCSDAIATIVFVGYDGIQLPELVFRQPAPALSFLRSIATALPSNSELEPPIMPVSVSGDEGADQSDYPSTGDFVYQIVSTVPYTLDHTTSSGNISLVGELEPSKHSLPDSRSNLEAALKAATHAGVELLDSSVVGRRHRPSTLMSPPSSVGRLSVVCRSVQRQLLARAFYGWLAYVRHVKTVRTQLATLVITPVNANDSGHEDDVFGVLQQQSDEGRDIESVLPNLMSLPTSSLALRQVVYSGRCDTSLLRRRLWPLLLGVQGFEPGVSDKAINATLSDLVKKYDDLCAEWQAAEVDAGRLGLGSSTTGPLDEADITAIDRAAESIQDTVDITDVFQPPTPLVGSSGKKRSLNGPTGGLDTSTPCRGRRHQRHPSGEAFPTSLEVVSEPVPRRSSSLTSLFDNSLSAKGETKSPVKMMDEKNPTITLLNCSSINTAPQLKNSTDEHQNSEQLAALWLTNLHRIDKDVARCDRSLEFFRANSDNLEALRRLVCSYVWRHLDPGYIQGMCDLAAPLLVVLGSESLAFACLCRLLEDRLGSNFPNGIGVAAIDVALSRLRSLLQTLDPELYEHLLSASSPPPSAGSTSSREMVAATVACDATHLYFAYRWLLLDFKREFAYEDVFRVWEVIWSADQVASVTFSLFVALALIEMYRDVIIAENMDFTDIIKFFNDMAERHDATAVLELARQLVKRVQETTSSSPKASVSG